MKASVLNIDAFIFTKDNPNTNEKHTLKMKTPDIKYYYRV